MKTFAAISAVLLCAGVAHSADQGGTPGIPPHQEGQNLVATATNIYVAPTGLPAPATPTTPARPVIHQYNSNSSAPRLYGMPARNFRTATNHVPRSSSGTNQNPIPTGQSPIPINFQPPPPRPTGQ